MSDAQPDRSDTPPDRDPKRLMERGIRLSDSLQHLKALECFRQASEAFDAQGDTRGKLDAMHWVARSLLEEGRDKEAFPIWDEVLDAGTPDVAVYEFLIGQLAERGRDEDALRIWELRRDRFPDDPPAPLILAGVAEVHLRTGNEEAAEDLYRQAIESIAAQGGRHAWVREKQGRALLKHDRPLEAAAAFLTGIAEAGEEARGVASKLRGWVERTVSRLGIPKPVGYTEALLATLKAQGVDAALDRLRRDRPEEAPAAAQS